MEFVNIISFLQHASGIRTPQLEHILTILSLVHMSITLFMVPTFSG